MFALSSHLRGAYYSAIFYGLVSTICIGWPFVAVTYIPLGLHSLHVSWNNPHATTTSSRALATAFTLVFAVTCSAVLSFSCLLVDYNYYGVLTVPNLNIFMYNAVGDLSGEDGGVDTGDEVRPKNPHQACTVNPAKIRHRFLTSYPPLHRHLLRAYASCMASSPPATTSRTSS